MRRRHVTGGPCKTSSLVRLGWALRPALWRAWPSGRLVGGAPPLRRRLLAPDEAACRGKGAPPRRACRGVGTVCGYRAAGSVSSVPINPGDCSDGGGRGGGRRQVSKLFGRPMAAAANSLAGRPPRRRPAASLPPQTGTRGGGQGQAGGDGGARLHRGAPQATVPRACPSTRPRRPPSARFGPPQCLAPTPPPALARSPSSVRRCARRDGRAPVPLPAILGSQCAPPLCWTSSSPVSLPTPVARLVPSRRRSL